MAWEGVIHPRKEGNYSFVLLCSDHAQARLEMKGKGVFEGQFHLALENRRYPVKLDFVKTGGFQSAFHFLWKPPGADHYEVLPPEAME